MMRIKTEQLVPLLEIDFEGVCESASSELEGVGDRCAKCGQEIQIQEEFAHLGSFVYMSLITNTITRDITP